MLTKQSFKSETLVKIPLKKVRQLHLASVVMADLAEDILEEYGDYTDEFLASLARAEADIKAGRVYTVKSLDELLEK